MVMVVLTNYHIPSLLKRPKKAKKDKAEGPWSALECHWQAGRHSPLSGDDVSGAFSTKVPWRSARHFCHVPCQKKCFGVICVACSPASPAGTLVPTMPMNEKNICIFLCSPL